MMQRIRGIDVLRGLGIFVLLMLHSAFYYYGYIYELDFENPPLIITIIGFLLMFAGLFAILSGISHVITMENDYLSGKSIQLIRKKKLFAGLFILLIAYVYFIFVGPALVMFEIDSMNHSIIVELIRNSNITFTNLDRVFYIDSLVMIGTNIILLGIIYPWLIKKQWNKVKVLLPATAVFMIISLVRIPLYTIYLDSIDQGHLLTTILLNPFVNKNNPIFPYFGFALLGASVAKAYLTKQTKWIVPTGFVVFIGSMIGYILLPDTMLERLIDLKWFSIMWAQMGIFLLLVALFVWMFKTRKTRHVFKYFERFGYAGLTPFFYESIFAAIIYRVLDLIFGPLKFDIAASIGFGFGLALIWGILLIVAEKHEYPGFIEKMYVHVINHVDESTKGIQLKRKIK
ncbi:MAG: DUF1624 domain-containing protein [Firmicutes bacterium]|nr:DUF1624 domain-containing protein [Bacillota bacterium]